MAPAADVSLRKVTERSSHEAPYPPDVRQCGARGWVAVAPIYVVLARSAPWQGPPPQPGCPPQPSTRTLPPQDSTSLVSGEPIRARFKRKLSSFMRHDLAGFTENVLGKSQVTVDGCQGRPPGAGARRRLEGADARGLADDLDGDLEQSLGPGDELAGIAAVGPDQRHRGHSESQPIQHPASPRTMRTSCACSRACAASRCPPLRSCSHSAGSRSTGPAIGDDPAG